MTSCSCAGSLTVFSRFSFSTCNHFMFHAHFSPCLFSVLRTTMPQSISRFVELSYSISQSPNPNQTLSVTTPSGSIYGNQALKIWQSPRCPVTSLVSFFKNLLYSFFIKTPFFLEENQKIQCGSPNLRPYGTDRLSNYSGKYHC